VAIGALLIFLGVAASARFLAAPVVRVIGTPWRRLGGVASKVAVDNAVRNPRRTAATASALMVGLALVVTTLVVGESVRTAIRDGLARSVSADVVADSGSIAPFDAAALRSIAAVPGVADAAPLGTSRVDTVGARGRLTVSSGDLPSLTSMVDPELSAGRLPEVVGEVAVASKWADAAGVSVGSMFELRSADAAVPVRVVGIYRRNELLDDSLTVPATLAALPGVDVADRLVFVRTAPGADAVAVASQVGEAVAAVPNSSARVTDDFVVQRTSSVDVILGIVSVLLLFSVAVAALGIANTLALSVVERTRELGLLRAVGMTRRRVRRMVRIEGVIIAAFGATLGVALGTAFGAALVAVLPAATAELHLPWARLLVLLILGALIGIAAAALPARRAARLDVLAAVTTD
jgi:putative ABC transport system permease protein